MSTDATGGLTYLRVERGSAGRVRAVTRTGALAPRLVHLGPDAARVVLVGTRALLLAGDHVDLRIEVGEGVHLDLSDVAATVAYDGRGTRCSWSAHVLVESAASLVWRAEPFVVSSGADTSRSLVASVHPDARLELRDTLVLGRDAQQGGTVRARTEIATGRRPVLVEDLDVSGAQGQAAVLGGARVVDQLVVLGAHLAPVPGCVTLDLPGGGRALRWLGDHTHHSPLGAGPAGRAGADA